MLEIRLALRVRSEILTLPGIVRLLGAPTSGYSIGDPSNGGKSREQTLWKLESNLERTDRLDAHLSHLLTFCEKHSGQLEQIRKECTLDFSCQLSTENGQGGAAISIATLQRIAACEVALAFDVYYVGASA
jgi:hypothetical protein